MQRVSALLRLQPCQARSGVPDFGEPGVRLPPKVEEFPVIGDGLVPEIPGDIRADRIPAAVLADQAPLIEAPGIDVA